MKSKVYLAPLFAAFTLASLLHAQDTLAPSPATRPAAPAADDVPAAPAAPFRSQTTVGALPGTTPAANPAAEAAPENPFVAAQDQMRRAAAETARADAQFAAAQAEFDRGMAGQQWSSAPSAAQPGLWWQSPAFGAFKPNVESEGTLVIRTSEPDQNALAHAEEDLNIMGRILEKAVAQNSEDEQPQAMGIRLLTLASHPPLRNLQIEGFGNVFFLNVNFPLVGPARSTGNQDEKTASNSTWDQAKRELYGPAPGAEGPDESSSKEAYDPKRVEKLKDTLLNALKNATNIRSLKPDESVMVVVNGSAGENWLLSRATRFQNRLTRLASADRAGAGGGGGGTGGGQQPSAAGIGQTHQPGYAIVTQDNRTHTGSVLTIQARKSDIDAFAAGKLDLREFHNKVKMLVYPTISSPHSDETVVINPQTR